MRDWPNEVPREDQSVHPTVSTAAVRRWPVIVLAFTLAAAGIAGGFIRRNTPDAPAALAEVAGEQETPAVDEPPATGDSPVPVASPDLGSLVRIDATTGEIVARVPIPRPTLVASDGDSVWVLSEGIFGGGALVHVEAATDAITGVSAVEFPTTTELAVAGGSAWLGSDRGTAYRFAPGAITGEPARFDVASSEFLWPVAAAGSLWISCCRLPPTLLRVDPATGRVLARIDRVERVVASGTGFLWALDWEEGRASRLVRIDTETHATVPIGALGFRWFDLTVADGAVWASSPKDGSIVRLDPLTGEANQRIPVGGEPGALAAGAGAVWAAIGKDATVTRYVIAADRIEAIDVGGTPIDLVFARDSVWVMVSPP